MTLLRAERALLASTLLAIMLPLQIDFGYVGLALFEIPLAGLLCLWGLRAAVRPEPGRGAPRPLEPTPA